MYLEYETEKTNIRESKNKKKIWQQVVKYKEDFI